eukprot:12288411-Ditylum_brightwellii.AAC.1
MVQRGKGRNALIITPTHNAVRSALLLPKLERKQQQQQPQQHLGLMQHQPPLLLYQQPMQDRQAKQQ